MQILFIPFALTLAFKNPASSAVGFKIKSIMGSSDLIDV